MSKAQKGNKENKKPKADNFAALGIAADASVETDGHCAR
jgi:hypothetical protein